MKIRLYIQYCLLGFVFILCTSFSNHQQCDPDKLFKKHSAALGDYSFIKSFPLEIEKGEDKAEYFYIMSRDVNYRIVVCSENSYQNRMIINLYGRDKKPLTSNYDKRTKTYTETLDFICPSTGVYRVEAFFEHHQKGCGLNILGFKKPE